MPERRKSGAATFARIVFAIVVVAVAFLAPRYYGDPAPLGAPLPEISYAYETEGITPKDTSLRDMKIAPEWLEFLVPQPDGAPPLRYLIDSFGVPFEIWHPLGFETVVFPFEQQQETRTLAIAVVSLGQPLRAVKYSLPIRRQGESVSEYAERAMISLEENGARFLGDPGTYEMDGYSFITTEYQRDSEDGLLYHKLFIGSCGPAFALVIDFSAAPEDQTEAQKYINKIIGSFKPGDEMKRLYREESEAAPGDAEQVPEASANEERD